MTGRGILNEKLGPLPGLLLSPSRPVFPPGPDLVPYEQSYGSRSGRRYQFRLASRGLGGRRKRGRLGFGASSVCAASTLLSLARLKNTT